MLESSVLTQLPPAAALPRQKGWNPICSEHLPTLMSEKRLHSSRRSSHLREGEATAGSFVVFIGALELKVLPPNPPQHSGQLLLQLQFPAGEEKKKKQAV